MIPTRPTSLALLLLLALPACRSHADTATASPGEAAIEAAPADAPADVGADAAEDEGADEGEAPEPEAAEASASTEVIEIGVADVGSAATITATPERPPMPSMMSDITMAPSR